MIDHDEMDALLAEEDRRVGAFRQELELDGDRALLPQQQAEAAKRTATSKTGAAAVMTAGATPAVQSGATAAENRGAEPSANADTAEVTELPVNATVYLPDPDSVQLPKDIPLKDGLVDSEMVAWTAKAVYQKLGMRIDSVREDIAHVDVERKRNQEEITAKMMVFFIAIIVITFLLLSTIGMYKGFNAVLFGVYCAGGAVLLFFTGRGLADAATKHFVRDKERPYPVVIKSYKVVSYEKEKYLLEEQIVWITKFIREAERLERRSERRGGLPLAKFERLNILQYVQRKPVLSGWTKDFTCGEYVRAWFKNT
ncbi:MAG: hypothetical protein K6E71_09575 [Lachnospiraceae bacterium]|nr:hypothetical protein [Lachnospiraceae bacterium]